MSAEVDIRILTREDAIPFWYLRLEALELEPQSFGESADEHRRTSVDLAAERLATDSSNSFVFGAFLQGELVGTAGFYRYQISKARHKGRVWGVYVRENCRGRGIGRELVTAVLKQIKSCPGIEQVSLTVVRGQQAAAALYRSLGFRTYGIEPRGLKDGTQYFDVEHMVLFTAG